MPSKPTKTLPGATDRRIDALLALLSENSTIVISGAQIAKEIGVSRQQVFRWIETLRALGVKVKGHASAGYPRAAIARAAAARDRLLQAHSPFFQGGVHEYHRHASGRSRRSAWNCRACRGADRRPRTRWANLAHGKIRGDFVHSFGAAAHSSSACAAIDARSG